MDFRNFNEKNMINIIYQLQDEKIDKILKNTDKTINNKLKEIDFEKIVKNSNDAKELNEIFNKIEDNYNIKITEYNKEIYKQGFIDGVNLMIDCLKD